MCDGQVVLVTGASGGLGRLSANALALGGHTVYAAMRETSGRHAPEVEDIRVYAHDEGVDLRTIELDPGNQDSVDPAIAGIIGEHGRIDGCVHVYDAVVNGTITGDIEVEHFLELQPNARIAGNISYRQMRVDCGATIEGRVERMAEPVAEPACAEPVAATGNVVALPRG